MVPREARGGGLVLFWRDTMAVTVEGSDKYHIDVIINKNTDSAWRFTGFYGEPETKKRPESWNLLRRLNRKFQIPWLCAGDFNELLRSDEKWGEIEEVTIRCSYFERLWMLVVFWILDIRGPSSLGANTMQVGNLCGRGLIGLLY